MNRKLVVYEVRKGHANRWTLYHGDSIVHISANPSYRFRTRVCAIQAAGRYLTWLAATYRQRSELRIRNIDGTYSPARTYPRSADPKRSRG